MSACEFDMEIYETPGGVDSDPDSQVTSRIFEGSSRILLSNPRKFQILIFSLVFFFSFLPFPRRLAEYRARFSGK